MASITELFRQAQRHAQAGRHDAAIATYQNILKQDPSDIRARYRIAVMHLMAGRYADGETLLRACLRQTPDNPDILYSLGRTCLAQSNYADAITFQTKAARLAPKRADIMSALGDAYYLSGNPEKAFEGYRAAIALAPDDMRTRVNIATLINRSGNHDDAVEFMRPAYEAAGENAQVARIFAETLRANGAFDEALGVIEKVLVQAPDDLDAICAKAGILDRSGDNRAAAALLLPLLESGTQTPELARVCGQVALNQSEPVLPIERVLALIEACVNHNSSSTFERRGLLFMLAGLLDRQGEYSRAFELCQAANLESKATYDRIETGARFAAYRDTFSPENLLRLSRASVRTTRPLFIVGMPRSGTTLVEQILDSHPDVAGGGELTDIQFATRKISGYPASLSRATSAELDAVAESYISVLENLSPDARYVTDKMPVNFEHLGFIWQAFPDARIVHCRRHPLDVCLSCLFRNFQTENRFAQDIESLADYYRHYHAQMDFWEETLDQPRFDLRYDDLVADPEKTVAALLDFCDLPWDDACLAFDKNRRFIKTASYAQVRRPINTAGLGRHLKYAAQLAPLAEALSDEIARYEAGGAPET
ncbi:MAG: sulfotransferase [Proteobacteria bacterium]|nr:sulfotransferase [Pseudomonadota bacterium]